MGGNDASTRFLQTIALAVTGLLTSMILSSIGIALMVVGVVPVPEVLADSAGYSVDYAISPSGVMGIISLILAALVLVWTLFTAMGLYKKGVAAQLDPAG